MLTNVAWHIKNLLENKGCAKVELYIQKKKVIKVMKIFCLNFCKPLSVNSYLMNTRYLLRNYYATEKMQNKCKFIVN